jgi:chaperonin cofactor prefoldin
MASGAQQQRELLEKLVKDFQHAQAGMFIKIELRQEGWTGATASELTSFVVFFNFHLFVEELQVAGQEYNSISSQLQENLVVQRELEMLKQEESAIVFKKVGPLLVKQSRESAAETVAKRIEFLKKSLQTSQERVRGLQHQAMTLQRLLQQAQQ